MVKEGIKIDIASGTSVGAINAGYNCRIKE
jgi:predicted acylesterase/phospholipase RssA